MQTKTTSAPTSVISPSRSDQSVRHFFLRTERLGFAWWRREDVQLALQLWNNPDVMRYCDSKPPDAERIKARLDKEISYAKSHGIQYWPLFELSTGKHVGCCGLHPWDDKLELGYYLRPEHWGKGFASEAARAIVEYAFHRFDLDALYAETHTENVSSQKVLKGLSFIQSPGSRFFEPLGIPLYTFSLSRERFAALRAVEPG